MKIFTVYDTKTETYIAPFVFGATGAAIRAFSDMVNDDKKSNPYASHPEDYILFEIGCFDAVTGEITPCAPKSLGKALDFLNKIVD